MKFILLSLAIAFFIIGMYESVMVGFAASYFLFMLAIGFIAWARLVIIKEGEKAKVGKAESAKPVSKKRK